MTSIRSCIPSLFNATRWRIILIASILLTNCASIHSRPQKSDRSSDVSTTPAAALVSQGNQFARDGLLRESVSSYKQALAAEPANMTAQRNLGIVLVKAGDYTSAVSYLEKSMSVYNDNFDANYYLAEAYRALDNYGEAIFRYKSALKIQKDDPKALKSLAWCYYKTRYFTEALNISQKLLVSNPRDDQVPIIVARVYLRLKRSGEALALVRKYGARVSGSSQPYYWSVEGDILNERGETAEASQVYQRALKAQPMLAGALLGMAKIHLAQGKTNLAVDHLERAVRIKPRMFEAHYYLGCALESTDPKRALRYFAFFRKNSASDPEHLDLIQDAKKRIVQLTSGGSKIDGIGN